MRKIAIPAAGLALAALLSVTGCGGSSGSSPSGNASSAQARLSSAAANPTASADIAQVEKVFKPCFEPADGSVPTIHGAISCAQGKVPAVQDKTTRRTVLFGLGTCELTAYHQAGSWAAFKVSGWQSCAQTAYNAALAAGGTTPAPVASASASKA